MLSLTLVDDSYWWRLFIFYLLKLDYQWHWISPSTFEVLHIDLEWKTLRKRKRIFFIFIKFRCKNFFILILLTRNVDSIPLLLFTALMVELWLNCLSSPSPGCTVSHIGTSWEPTSLTALLSFSTLCAPCLFARWEKNYRVSRKSSVSAITEGGFIQETI